MENGTTDHELFNSSNDSDSDGHVSSGAPQSPATIDGSALSARDLALIEAQHNALMETLTRASALGLSSALALICVSAYYYCHIHSLPIPAIPDWVMGVIFSSFGGEIYVQMKKRTQKKQKPE